MLLKPLQETQFPWRWLVLISMGGSILAAAGLPMISNGVRAKRMLVLGAMAISIAFTLSHVVREAQYFPPQKFETMVTDVRGSSCVNYWFPIWARADVRKMTTEVEANGRDCHRELVATGTPKVFSRGWSSHRSTRQNLLLPTLDRNE